MASAAALDDYAAVSTPDGEPVAIFERVSTDMSRQEIASQTRDLVAHIGANGYRVARVFRIEASAYHGKHDPELRAALADVRAGRYAKVVAATSSRFERRGWKTLLRYMIDLDEAGGRLVAADNPAFGDMATPMGGISALMDGETNFRYSEAVSKNVRRTNRLYDERGAHRGGIFGGYATQCAVCERYECGEGGHKGNKRLVPHPVTAELVVQAFIDAAKDASTPKIARTFKAANERYGLRGGLRLPATADAVASLLRNPAYGTGHHKDGSACRCKFPPLVSPAQQEAAVAALKRRRTGGSVSSRVIAKDDYSGALGCPECRLTATKEPARMYRYYAGRRVLKDGTKPDAVRRYKCEHCGKSVRADSADEAVNAAMRADVTPWYVPRVSDPNAERDRAIAEVEAELKALPALGLAEDDEDERRAVLRAKRRELREIPDAEVTTYADVRTDERGRRLTEGDRWEMMTPAERRDVLTGGSVVALVKAKPGRTGAVAVEIQRERDTDA